jgi:hypothetical protein
MLQSWPEVGQCSGTDGVIGVIAKADQVAVVEEFFELFKTPWEFYQQGRAYDVVITTSDAAPEVNARLLIVYGAETKSTDSATGITVGPRHRGGSLEYEQIAVPLYGDFATFEETGTGIPCLKGTSGITGVRVVPETGAALLRLGYDLFAEVHFLLTAGQPIENAHIPTLDIHIAMLRKWILAEGIPLLEISAAPAGYRFAVCLTHDIDFVGIRNHKFDHTMWGFLHRSTVGAIQRFFQRKISLSRLFAIWRAAASLPLVYLGWVKDFWAPFEWYLNVEKNLPATYFLIPFKRRAGERVPGRNASRRATAYDAADLPQWTSRLMSEGCEVGVHGIDAWHSVEKGMDELARVSAVTRESRIGIRMHWLLHDENTFRVLEEAGYAYDSTAGYNETIGFRSGTTQVFRPMGATTLLEVPLHIQDGALFYPQRLDLSEPEAWKRCQGLIDCARASGGVLTVLWHDRSHGPERFWGDFYISLVQALRSSDAWFGTASQISDWFRKRRKVGFDLVDGGDGPAQMFLRYEGEQISPPLNIRIHRPQWGTGIAERRSDPAPEFVDIPWTDDSGDNLDQLLRRADGLMSAGSERSIEQRDVLARKGQSANFLP